MSWQTQLCVFVITQPPALVDVALTEKTGKRLWLSGLLHVSCGCVAPRSGFKPLLYYNFYL
jgi:hypothetical protein